MSAKAAHGSLAAKREADERARKEEVGRRAQGEADQEARIVQLQAENEQREKKAREKLMKARQQEAEEEKAKRQEIQDGYQKLLVALLQPYQQPYNLILDEGSDLTWTVHVRSVQTTWKIFWMEEYMTFRRHSKPERYTDYSEVVVKQACQLLKDGVSDDTDVLLQIAQERSEAKQTKLQEKSAAAISEFFEHSTNAKEVSNSLMLRFSDEGGDILIHPLVLAAKMDNHNALSVMLSHCHPEAQTDAFIAAAALGHEKIVVDIVHNCHLLENSVPFALSEACKNGHLGIVKVLIAKFNEKLRGVCLWPQFTEQERTYGVLENALHKAIDGEYIDLMQLLLCTDRLEEEGAVHLGGMSQAKRIMSHTMEKDIPAMIYALLESYPHLLDDSVLSCNNNVRRRTRFCLWHNSFAEMRSQLPHRPDITATCFADLHMKPLV